MVASVDYRLAPEHPFPAAHEDALAAACWALRNVATLGGDPAHGHRGRRRGRQPRCCTCIALRGQRGPGAPLAAQLLIVPGVDMARDTLALEVAGRDFPMLAPPDLRDIARLAMGHQAALAATAFRPRPLRAASLAGLPPAFCLLPSAACRLPSAVVAVAVAVAGHDPLYGEGLEYAARLPQADVRVELHRFEDGFHPFFGFFCASRAAARANDAVCRAFAARLRAPGAQGTEQRGVDR